MVLRLNLRLSYFYIQNLSRYFLGTGTWIKDRPRHKQATDRNRLTQYRHSKVFMMIFIRPVWTGIFSFSIGLVLGPALYPVPRKDRKKLLRIWCCDHFMSTHTQNSISLHSNILNTILINFYYSPIYPDYLFFFSLSFSLYIIYLI